MYKVAGIETDKEVGVNHKAPEYSPSESEGRDLVQWLQANLNNQKSQRDGKNKWDGGQNYSTFKIPLPTAYFIFYSVPY